MSNADIIKAGSRFRITIEVEALKIDSDEDWWFSADGSDREKFWVRPSALVNAPIEIIEQPLAVGDRVTWGAKTSIYTLVAIEGDMGILWNGSFANNHPLRILERIP